MGVRVCACGVCVCVYETESEKRWRGTCSTMLGDNYLMLCCHDHGVVVEHMYHGRYGLL